MSRVKAILELMEDRLFIFSLIPYGCVKVRHPETKPQNIVVFINLVFISFNS